MSRVSQKLQSIFNGFQRLSASPRDIDATLSQNAATREYQTIVCGSPKVSNSSGVDGVGRIIVSISLFVNLHRARGTILLNPDTRYRNNPLNLYSIKFIDRNSVRTMGWIKVFSFEEGPSRWHKTLRERRDIHALFSDGDFGPVPEVGQKARKLDWQPLQFATTYRVRAFREKTAARKAWNLLLSGSRPHTEWYDASPDK